MFRLERKNYTCNTNWESPCGRGFAIRVKEGGADPGTESMVPVRWRGSSLAVPSQGRTRLMRERYMNLQATPLGKRFCLLEPLLDILFHGVRICI